MKDSVLLRTNNLGISFGGLSALDAVDFECQEGERIGVIGPNGAGKTTFFSLLSGFLKPTTGHIWFGGERIDGLEPHRICRLGLCRTFQISQPFASLSVRENVLIAGYLRYSQKQVRKETDAILETLSLLDKADMEAKELSLGDQKRLELARALATKPKLLLMDEIAAGMNTAEIDDLIRVIIRLNQDEGIAFIVVEHVLQSIRALSQRIVVLDHGLKIADGKPEEIATDNRVIDAYLGGETLLAGTN